MLPEPPNCRQCPLNVLRESETTNSGCSHQRRREYLAENQKTGNDWNYLQSLFVNSIFRPLLPPVIEPPTNSPRIGRVSLLHLEWKIMGWQQLESASKSFVQFFLCLFDVQLYIFMNLRCNVQITIHEFSFL
uniref:Uncharacterized protein n=1 Tax=Nicotiana tabacum TaxID=4097 RepID=A0A1S4AEF2_TOBAC|nr:uncharacterized protein LOC104108052 [Nicotiana tomentosiformis]XP_016475016.1 PREDICTED: uncharacterized protein LOC107796729 [Nicotiana tabacum]